MPNVPQPLKIREFKGQKTGTHIVGLKDGVSMTDVINLLDEGDKDKIGLKWESINSFSGVFSAFLHVSACQV